MEIVLIGMFFREERVMLFINLTLILRNEVGRKTAFDNNAAISCLLCRSQPQISAEMIFQNKWPLRRS